MGKKKKDKKSKPAKAKQNGKENDKKKPENKPAKPGESGEKRKKLNKKYYERELVRLQVELVKLQEWIKDQELKVVVLFLRRRLSRFS